MQPAGPMCPAHPPATTEQPKPSQKTHVVFFSFCWSARSNAIDSRLCALLLSFLPAFCLRHLLYYFLLLLPPNLYCIYIKVRVQNLFGHRLQEVLRADVPSSSTWSWGGCCWDSRLLPTTIKCRYSLYPTIDCPAVFFLGTLRDVFYFLLLLKERKQTGWIVMQKKVPPFFLYGTVVLRGRRCLLISQRWKDTFYFLTKKKKKK